MRFKRLVGFASFAFAVCLLLTLGPAALAKPKAAPGEPAIERGEKDQFGVGSTVSALWYLTRQQNIPVSRLVDCIQVLVEAERYIPKPVLYSAAWSTQTEA